ncbi:hypothetical protein IAR55_006983 [Kwoniella newhampshirensis]|uniref:GYF domain-containing protein n=1 Tax=Kwoniella newhampshirensis TaxID=1651941 RepID=A0AAW0YPY2_9TREE
MSMHFAPQWVKPIKPSGPSLTPTSESPSTIPRKSTLSSTTTHLPHANSNVPFPALSHAQRAASPTTATSNNPPLTYSRVTHTPLSPSVPGDGSYFPYQEPNGAGAEPTAHPFRYSREQILALFDESKFKERPIELVEMAEGGAVLVSKGINRPVGLRDLSEAEKKLLASSVHPPMPVRRPGSHTVNVQPIEPPTPNGLPSRRSAGFGRGEGGAFGGGFGGKIGTIGGGVLSPGGLESKAPGALGGGFGGVPKRLGRTRVEGGEVNGDGPRSTANTWRPSRTTSGNFEGVLGFGIPAAPPPAPLQHTSPTLDTHDEAKRKAAEVPQKVEGAEEKKEEDQTKFGKGGGPGWGSGQKKWRIAAGLATSADDSKTLDIPITNEAYSASVVATPSATPIPERDAMLFESTPVAGGRTQQPNGGLENASNAALEEKENLGAVEWFYRDPNGQEQGPFTGTQMHDWYSHSYFTDDLPLRRAQETTFQPLAELKTATGNAVQPFLSPVRPRQLPPNLPIPIAALQQTPLNGHLPDAYRNLALQSPMASDPRLNTQPNPQSTPGPYQHAFLPDRATFSPNAYPQQPFNQVPSPGPFGPAPGQAWNSLPPQNNLNPRLNGPFGSIGMPSPIGSGPLPFMQQQQQQQFFSPPVGSPVQAGDMFSPSLGVGAIPTSPWGVPQPQLAPTYQQAPGSHQPSPASAWPTEQPQQTNQVIEEAVAEVLAPIVAADEASSAAELANGSESTATAGQGEEEVVEKVGSSGPEPVLETPAQDASSPTKLPAPAPAKAAPTLVWGQKPSRQQSMDDTASVSVPATPATTTNAPSKLPPAPSSLPAKPAPTVKLPSTAEVPVMPKAVDVATPGPTAHTEQPAAPKAAPWALAKEDKDIKAVMASPSLREIQEAEARVAEARKQALAEARAASASPAPPASSVEDFPTSISWGLPSSTKAPAVSSPAAPSTPVGPAWGSGDAGPKKTLKQIQEEEEKRKIKAAQAARIAQATVSTPGVQSKRGYADLAANAAHAPPAPIAAGWTTVGAGGKLGSGTPLTTTTTTASRVVTPATGGAKTVSSILAAKPATPVPVAQTPAAVKPKVDESAAPSVEFIRWTKQALTGFKGDLDDFIQVLLSFPIDPAPSARADQLEIISDSVYANSSTLDGRRFAQDFYTKRKADALARKNGQGSGGTGGAGKTIASLADVVKTQPKAVSADMGFKVVKGKGKKKT